MGACRDDGGKNGAKLWVKLGKERNWPPWPKKAVTQDGTSIIMCSPILVSSMGLHLFSQKWLQYATQCKTNCGRCQPPRRSTLSVTYIVYVIL